MDGTLTPSQKGAVAETAIIAAATCLGWRVYIPVSEGGRCDLVLDVMGRRLGVQCKWGVLDGDVLKVWLRTSRLTPAGYVRSTYSAAEIDAFAIYSADLDRCYLLPIQEFAGQAGVHLRLGPARNNQRLRLKWAAQYEFGAIAQLGERGVRNAEVVGSSPTSST